MQKSSGRPLTAEDDVERVRAIFLHSPKKSTATLAKELSMSKTTVWMVLRKRLVYKPYRVQMVQQWSDENHRHRLHFCFQLQDLMSSDDHFLEKVQFSDEATFNVSGAVYRRMSEYGDLKTHMAMWTINVTPKVNVFCAVSTQKVYGPFFFAEETVTGMTYLDTLQLWLMPQLQKARLQDIPTFVFQQHGIPDHFHFEVRRYLNSVTRTLDRASVWK